eukprot:6216258-Alexandrium_andersonii.AAC.1
MLLAAPRGRAGALPRLGKGYFALWRALARGHLNFRALVFRGPAESPRSRRGVRDERTVATVVGRS